MYAVCTQYVHSMYTVYTQYTHSMLVYTVLEEGQGWMKGERVTTLLIVSVTKGRYNDFVDFLSLSLSLSFSLLGCSPVARARVEPVQILE